MAETTTTILLVEDDAFMASALQELLETASGGVLLVQCAMTLADALAHLAMQPADVVLLDLHLPDSEGIETLRRINAKAAEAAVVVLTGLDDESLAAQALHEGAQDYLVKGNLSRPLLLKSIRFSQERKRFQQELRVSQAQVLQSEKMASVGQLAAGIAHEINNPVGFITSNLNTLASYFEKLQKYQQLLEEALPAGTGDGPERAEQRKKLKIDYILADIPALIAESRQGADHIKEIVMDLKNFSRADQLRKKEEADINRCLESTLNVVWNELKYKATVRRELGDLPAIRCYPQQLNQVFMNLLLNAVQALGEQGEITIRTGADGDAIWVAISDTGCGIAPQHLNRIFEPFFTTKDVGKGTGLGLSIAYDIVTKKHGGTISVQSEVGNGTTFTVRLPVAGVGDDE